MNIFRALGLRWWCSTPLSTIF